MKYLILKSHFDLQKQRIFCIKSVFKKKYKTNFIYLFSARKFFLVYAKPQYLNFQNLVSFKKGGVFCKQKNLFLRSLTGLPIINVIMRYSYFDFNNILDRVSLQERYNFEMLNMLNKNVNISIIKKHIAFLFNLKKITFYFFYHINVLYSFRAINKAFFLIVHKKKKNIFVANIISLLKTRFMCYFFFYKTIFKKYLYILNIKLLKLKNILDNNAKMYLFALDLLFFFSTKQVVLKNCDFFFFTQKYILYFNRIKRIKFKVFKFKNFKFSNIFYLKKQYNKFFIFNISKFNVNYKFLIKKHVNLNNLFKFFINLNNIQIYFLNYYEKLNINLYLTFRNSLKNYVFANVFIKKTNLFYFNKFKNKTNLNTKIGNNFFFKNFILFNAKYFRKYRKYFFNKKIRSIKNLKKKNKFIANANFCGFTLNTRNLKLNRIFSLFYFFSFLLNRRHWFYFYRLYMPIMQLKFISSSNLDINFKVNFLSWFKKHKLVYNYKNSLCFLNYKNKYIYIYFYSYIYFKQLTGLRVYNLVSNIYLFNYRFYWNNYQYNYIDITLNDFYDNTLYLNKKSLLINLKKNRFYYIKNLLNFNLNINNLMAKPKNILYDFIYCHFTVFYNFINYKFLNYLQFLQKNKKFLFFRKNSFFVYNKQNISFFFLKF